ncbi:hypothetical protein ANN_20654 [Periplaneta americana]|uniref:Uncharacterized protein n=1 Tax=Periplaneta americana TaxID=6978 RepID=A0ABQ8SDD2_PERAM|nr:hypothetical protein ANN_20654 [Periplaneta americana]
MYNESNFRVFYIISGRCLSEDVQNVHLLLEYRPHIDVSLTCESVTNPRNIALSQCNNSIPKGFPNQTPETNKAMILNGPTSGNRPVQISRDFLALPCSIFSRHALAYHRTPVAEGGSEQVYRFSKVYKCELKETAGSPLYVLNIAQNRIRVLRSVWDAGLINGFLLINVLRLQGIPLKPDCRIKNYSLSLSPADGYNICFSVRI